MTPPSDNILSYTTKRPTFHPYVIACLSIAFIPDVMLLYTFIPAFFPGVFWSPDLIGDLPEELTLILGAMVLWVIPLICVLMSWRAIYQIGKSRGSQKGLHCVIATLILSILHLILGCLFALLVWAMMGKW